MKYLIVGLGNIGDEYSNTRHNIGFKVLDAFAKASSSVFKPDRYGDRCEIKHKGRTFVCIKPSTFMNLSGKAVKYWLQKEKLTPERLLIITDDIALPFGTLRLKPKGSDGGHNGFKSIQELIGGSKYPRLRFGVGSDFGQGQQVKYVLSNWKLDEVVPLEMRMEVCLEIIKSFGTIGLDRTMNQFNNK
ncbi:MAG: aminoacyl-tRNA hydrolase [Flavobacteriales bacterium]|nr:aminoacyl-tRNA hydrolase [Flavobacteriales bacterium]